MGKWCRKCALDQPHPFRHWHVRCPVCRTWTIFRGPACTPCLNVGREIMQEIINDERSNGS